MTDARMICPRDGGPMTTYSRAGVQIDQCDTCKGIFLDRGELEALTQAEQTYYQQPPPPVPGYGQPGYGQGGYGQGGYGPADGYYGGEHHGEYDGEHHGRQGHRRRGFLGNLFD